MIQIYKKQTNELLGRITEEQFKFLADHLEEESADDRDYYIERETVDQFENEGADHALVELLRASMLPGDSVEIRWLKEPPLAP